MDENSNNSTTDKSQGKNKVENKEEKTNVDEIKQLLGLPEFNGAKVYEHASSRCKITLPQEGTDDRSKFSRIPEYLRSQRSQVYGTSNIYASSSHDFLVPNPHNGSTSSNSYMCQEDLKNPITAHKAAADIIKLDPDILSGYDEYLRTCNGRIDGILRITRQSFLSLTLSDIQVDITVDGAIRIINPKAYIAMAINGTGTHVALMHPMGRVHQEGITVNVMAFDMMKGQHKFAKLYPQRAIFKSTTMTSAYVMDVAGCRTTMSNNDVPNMSSDDISLPVFYGTSNYGPLYNADAEKMLKCATRGLDHVGTAVWMIKGNIIVKYQRGEVRVCRPPNVFLRTSSVTGIAQISTENIHCTASQGDTRHLFASFGSSKVHFNGEDFKLRTMNQSAGIDGKNHINIYEQTKFRHNF